MAGGECAFKATIFEVEMRGREAVGRQFDGGRGEDEVALLFHSTRAREGDQRARRGSDLQPSATATSALARANIKGSWAEWA